jgi:AbrB family looped-hinge helix DNA binding protein
MEAQTDKHIHVDSMYLPFSIDTEAFPEYDILTYIKDIALGTIVSITKKGLVYIPQSYRQKLNIKPPAKIMATLKANKVIIEPIKDLSSYAGVFKKQAKKQIWKTYRDKMENNYVRL